MPAKNPDSTKDFAVPVVVVVDKNGGEAHVSTAVELNTLVFGEGYRVRDFDSVAEATNFLADKGQVAAPQSVQEAVAQQQHE